MENFKTVFILLVLLVSNNIFATSNIVAVERNPISFEILKLSKNHSLLVEKHQEVEMTFFLNEERQIVIQSVKSDNPQVKKIIAEKFQNTKLYCENWSVGISYTRSVKIQL